MAGIYCSRTTRRRSSSANWRRVFQLPDAVLANIAGSQRSTGLLHEPDGLFMVGLGDVEGVFKGGVVESFVIHGTSVVPLSRLIPANQPGISRECRVTGPSGPPF